MARKTVVVTGASGLLGRAVGEHFVTKHDIVVPLALTRAAVDPAYTKLDLTDREAVVGFFTNNKVDVVVHCAAERRPDVAEANPDAAERINVAVPAHLAQLARQYGFTLFYISTDYVFDGRNPPYEVDAAPNPLQMYGRQKLAGERAVLAERARGARIAVLRVPLLYGRTTYNAESAVNIIVDVVKDQSGKQYKMDHYQIRNPTNVEDVARVLYDLAHLEQQLPPVLHYRSPGPPLTKYDMTRIIGAALGLPIAHVVPQPDKPASGTERPWNTQLSTAEAEKLGVSVAEDEAFESWWRAYVKDTEGQ
ncbi:hypothetical protein Q5752_002905 [Cryptotrichosporon argae]